MKYSVRSGFSLIEVVMAFVIISVLALMVGGAVAASYIAASKLGELPNSYYNTQDEVEKEVAGLKDIITEKHRLDNEILNAPDDEVTSEMLSRQAELAEQLDGYDKNTVTLFSGTLYQKSVDLYEFRKELAYKGTHTLYYSGAANYVSPERPVPIIDKVEIAPVGESVPTEVYYAAGKQLKADVDYNEKNFSSLYRTMYQWFICTDDYHTETCMEESRKESVYGTIATYPDNFTLLPGETGETLEIKKEYEGRFIICVAVPLSKNGKIGRNAFSNFVYVSALPELSLGTYRAVIDPSLIHSSPDESGFTVLGSIESRTPPGVGNGRRLQAAGTFPKLSLEGAATDSDEAAVPKHYSRYIQFGSSGRMTASGITGSGMVFIVARNRKAEDCDFITHGEQKAGFLTKNEMTGTGEWKIIAANFDDFSSATVGAADVDVAELIFADGILSGEKYDGGEDDDGDDGGGVDYSAYRPDIDAIKAYLSAKYHIN